MQLITQMKKADGLTDTEKTVANYILTHRDVVGHITLDSLAKESASSKATVVRLCKKMGCSGYRDFQLKFIAELEHTLDEKDDIDFDYPFAQNEGIAGIVRSTVKMYEETAEICYNNLSRPDLLSAARFISKARCVYLYGIGESMIALKGFANQIKKLGILTIDPQENSEGIKITNHAGRNDVAIIASYSGQIFDHMKKDLALLKAHKCPIILISSTENDVGCDIHLYIPAKEHKDNKISVYYSFTAFNLIFSCLYGAIYGMNYDYYRKQKEEILDIINH